MKDKHINKGKTERQNWQKNHQFFPINSNSWQTFFSDEWLFRRKKWSSFEIVWKDGKTDKIVRSTWNSLRVRTWRQLGIADWTRFIWSIRRQHCHILSGNMPLNETTVLLLTGKSKPLLSMVGNLSIYWIYRTYRIYRKVLFIFLDRRKLKILHWPTNVNPFKKCFLVKNKKLNILCILGNMPVSRTIFFFVDKNF